jgi:plasmid stabilization system protein ParE
VRFTVTWHPCATEELTQIWLDAADRNDITQAANAIAHALADDPRSKDEEFYGDWLFVATPLAVTFAVHDSDRIVQVLQVRHQ